MTSSLPWFDAHDVAKLLPYASLIKSLQEGFQGRYSTPLRHHHYWGSNKEELLVMPAWDKESLVVKLVTLCPQNPSKGIAANNGVVVLFGSNDGQPLAMIDAGELTARRTAAASALASRYLSRPDASSLLVVGAGRLVTYLVEAHLAVRPIKQVRVWGRSPERARQAVERLEAELPQDVMANLTIEPVSNLKTATTNSDIITTITRSEEPLIRGEWLSPGTHLDLVGGYRPDMLEVDFATIQKATIVADTVEGVLNEAGDIIQPINHGLIDSQHIKGELHCLCTGSHQGRTHGDELTLFKSVGTAFEDLVASRLVYINAQKSLFTENNDQ